MRRTLALELVHATEWAALAAARSMGRGVVEAGFRAAGEALRAALVDARISGRLLDTRLFRPFRAWLVPGGRVSRRSKVVSLVLMWAAITLTVHLLLSGEVTRWISASGMVALGLIGTWFIVRHGRRSEPASG